MNCLFFRKGWYFLLLGLLSCNKWDLERVDFIVVITGDASNLTVISADVSGEVSGLADGIISQHGHVWSAAIDNPTINIKDGFTNNGEKDTNGIFHSSLTNLLANTTYWVRAYVFFEGKFFYGNIVRFTTDNISVATVSLEETEGEIRAVGHVAGLESGKSVGEHGHCWSYKKEVPRLNEDPEVTYHSVLGTRLSNGMFTSILDGILNNTIYYVRSYAIINPGKDTLYGEVLFGEFFRPNAWSPKSPFGGSGRVGAIAFSIGSKGYIGLGFGGNPETYLKDFWEYNMVTDNWTRKADFAGIPRSDAAYFSIGGKGYVGCGQRSPSNPAEGRVLKDFWEYDPLTDQWTRKADFAGEARDFSVSFSIDNRGYVGTGATLDDGLRDFWEYDPTQDQWIQKTDYPGGKRRGAAGFSVNQKGYIGTGGFDHQDFYEFDPATDHWSQIKNFPGVGRGDVFQFAIGNKGYVGSGSAFPTLTADVWAYDPITDSWEEKAAFPGGKTQGAVGLVIGDRAFAGLGWDQDRLAPMDFWEYIPE